MLEDCIVNDTSSEIGILWLWVSEDQAGHVIQPFVGAEGGPLSKATNCCLELLGVMDSLASP